MPRARKACSDPACPHLQPCPIHGAKAWEGSNRRRRVDKSGWQQQRDAQRILDAHDRICHVCGLGEADQVDHIIPLSENGPDTDANKRPIHSEPCHRLKTAREAARARKR